MKAAEHSPQQAERLRSSVRDRERYQLVPDEAQPLQWIGCGLVV